MSARLVVATLAGLLTGLICWPGALYLLGNQYDVPQVLNIFLHRVVMGFVIGISALRMSWQVHGLLLGLIVGSLFASYVFVTMDIHGTAVWVVIGLFPLGAIYGWLIEFITNKIAGLPNKATSNRH